MGTGLMLDAQDKADLIAFLHTLTDQALITDPRYASPF
jgi:cytochrome c peroxidase